MRRRLVPSRPTHLPGRPLGRFGGRALVLSPARPAGRPVVRRLAGSVAVGLMGIGLLLGLPSSAPAEDEAGVSDAYRATVKTFLEVTGSDSMGEQISDLMAQQTLASIASTGTPIDASIRSAVTEEARAEFGPTFGDIDYLTDLHAPIYEAHFSHEEMQELIAFYRTPLGQKTTRVMPRIAQEAGMALQQAAFDRIPAFQEKVQQRLSAAGIEIQR